jgi:hypothetical protein
MRALITGDGIRILLSPRGEATRPASAQDWKVTIRE